MPLITTAQQQVNTSSNDGSAATQVGVNSSTPPKVSVGNDLLNKVKQLTAAAPQPAPKAGLVAKAKQFLNQTTGKSNQTITDLPDLITPEVPLNTANKPDPVVEQPEAEQPEAAKDLPTVENQIEEVVEEQKVDELPVIPEEEIQEPEVIVDATPEVESEAINKEILPEVGLAPEVQKQANVRGMTSLLDALLAKGYLDADTHKSIKFESVTYSKPIEELVIEKSDITDDNIQRVKAEMFGVSFIDLSSLSIDQSVLQKVPQAVARQSKVIAFAEGNLSIKVGMIDPLDLQVIQYIESIVRKKVDPYFASASDIEQIINTKYGAEIRDEVKEALADVGTVYDLNATTTENLRGNNEDAPVIKIVNMVLDYAVKHGASDVHIEPHEARIAVRYRINGVLNERLTIPNQLAGPVITRIKILASMKIDEHRVPQDGRFQIKLDEKLVDLRVSVIPTVYGEKVVMRLLEKGGGAINLPDTGLSQNEVGVFTQFLSKTQGIILVTGPTGSGKTQTLASCLKLINKPDINILTLEDPVEIRIEGVNQVQVNSQVGLTFSSGLRSFLRQDPDVIMIGEIRDEETARLAIQASLTGHLVLATLHTNSAAGALPRLIDMGIESYLLSSTINLVVAQRLVRKIDPASYEVYEADQQTMDKLHEVLDPIAPVEIKYSNATITFDRNTTKVSLFRPKPTSQNDTGYGGRIGIFELLPIDNAVRELLRNNVTADQVQNLAVKAGMRTMMQDGFIKALEGVTTLEEVLRVVN